MSDTPMATWLELVTELATRTGDIALSKYRTGIAVDTKRDRSPVTEADRAAERFAREWIAARERAGAPHGGQRWFFSIFLDGLVVVAER